MNQNKLFQQTRLRLALWYALVMALILSLYGFGIYRAISHAHWMTLDPSENSQANIYKALRPVLADSLSTKKSVFDIVTDSLEQKNT